MPSRPHKPGPVTGRRPGDILFILLPAQNSLKSLKPRAAIRRNASAGGNRDGARQQKLPLAPMPNKLPRLCAPASWRPRAASEPRLKQRGERQFEPQSRAQGSLLPRIRARQLRLRADCANGRAGEPLAGQHRGELAGAIDPPGRGSGGWQDRRWLRAAAQEADTVSGRRCR